MAPDVCLHKNVVSAFWGGFEGCREPCCSQHEHQTQGDESALAITSADISNIAGVVVENGIFQARIIYQGGGPIPSSDQALFRGWLISNHFHLTPGINGSPPGMAAHLPNW